MKVWHNGEFVSEKQTHVSLLSHSFSRGSALFEVVDLINTGKGTMVVGLDEHIERFFNSASLSYMELPVSRDELKNAVLTTVRENGVKRGAVKFFAYYAGIEMKVTPSEPVVSVTIFATDHDDLGIQQSDLSKPVAVKISGYRKTHPESFPVHVKATGAYLNPYIAKMDAIEKGFDEVILLDTMGYVAEGSTCNLFLIMEDEVVTPMLRSVLPGITRMAVMDAVGLTNLKLSLRDIPAIELEQCQEAFFTSSLVKIQPIESIDGRKLGDSCPGKKTSAIMDQLSEVFEGKAVSLQKWLTAV